MVRYQQPSVAAVVEKFSVGCPSTFDLDRK